MSPLFVRLPLLTLLAASCCFTQGARAQTLLVHTESSFGSSSIPDSLPDAPSTSRVQEPVPAPSSTAPAPAPAQDSKPRAQGNAAGSAAPEEPLPGESQEHFRARIKLEAAAQVKKEESQRNLYILPNFNSVLAGETPPLSPGQKFDLVFHTAKDPYTFTIAFIVAGFGEINDSHVGYHWGPAGYFRRVGAAYGDNVDGAIWGNAILPSILHQDPRYFRRGPGHSIVSRVLWAAGSTVLCYGDNGKLQFNVSNIAGNFIAGGISNLYYPDDERGIGLAVSNAFTVSVEGAAGAQLLEFGPDLTALLERRRLRHRAFLQAKRDGTPLPGKGWRPPAPVPSSPADSTSAPRP